MRLLNLLGNKMRNPAWLICFAVVLALVCGTIVDVDHPISFYLGIADARFLHPYFNLVGYILISCGIIFLITCLCRYLWIRVLRPKK